MPTTGLGLTWDDLTAIIADQVHGTDETTRLDELANRRLKRWLLSGLRKFYYPSPSANGAFDWSFLESEFTITVDSGTVDYTMPATFGGLKGPLVHIPDDNVRISVTKVTPAFILGKRQQNLTLTNYPLYYAERAVHRGGIDPSTWQIMFWPTPSGDYTFKGTQRINPLAPNSQQPYLYGGPEHAQTIIEACLAEVELQMDGAPGPHQAAFAERLAASMALDGSMHAPESLGLNLNGGGGDPIARGGQFLENYADVTFGGTQYAG